MSHLLDTTVVTNPNTLMPVRLWAGEELPEWAEGLVGDHLLDVPVPKRLPPREHGVEPNRSGPGSALKEWVAYAGEIGHGEQVTPEMKQADVIQVLLDAGAIEPK